MSDNLNIAPLRSRGYLYQRRWRIEDAFCTERDSKFKLFMDRLIKENQASNLGYLAIYAVLADLADAVAD